MDSRNLDMLLLYSVLACVGRRLGRSVQPTHVTPLGVLRAWQHVAFARCVAHAWCIRIT